MMDLLFLISFGFLSIGIGFWIGELSKKDMRENQCPYCSCRDCCRIGFGVPTPIPIEEQTSFVCMKKG